MSRAFANGPEKAIKNIEQLMLMKKTQVCARLKTRFVSAPGLVAKRKNAVSIPNMKRILRTAAKAYNFTVTPYSERVNNPMVCNGTSKKFNIRGRMLPRPYKAVSPASLLSFPN